MDVTEIKPQLPSGNGSVQVETLTVDWSDLTLGDMREIKRLARERCDLGWKDAQDALEIGDPDMIIILAYVWKKRAEPNLTLDDMDDLKVSVFAPETPDPTSAAS